MRGQELRRRVLLRLGHALPKAERARGVVAALGHHQETEEVGFGLHLTGTGALDGEIDSEGGDLGGDVEEAVEQGDQGEEVELLAKLFARVVRDVVGDFVAEDGGEAVFVGADGEDAAEDEHFAAVFSACQKGNCFFFSMSDDGI